MRDASDPGTDSTSARPDTRRDLPIVDLGSGPRAPRATRSTSGPYDAGIDHCDFGAGSSARWLSTTASTYWTPLGQAAWRASRSRRAPVPRRTRRGLIAGQAYCVQVRARSGRVNLSDPVWGDFTQLDDGTGAAFTFTRLSHRRRLQPELQRELPRRTTTTCFRRSRTTRRTDRQSALHLEPDRRQAVVLGHRRQGSVLHEHRRLRVHADPRLCGANAEPRRARTRTRRRRTTGSSSPATGTNGIGGRQHPRARRLRRLREADRSRPTLLGPDNDATFSAASHLQLDSRRRARRSTTSRWRPSPRSPRARGSTTSRPPATEYTAQKTYTAVQDAVLARAGAGREQQRPHVVGDEDASRSTSTQPTLDPATPTLGDASLPVLRWFPVAGRRLLQPADPRAERQHAEHVLRASRPRRPPSRRSPARASSRGRSARTSRS